MALTSAETSQIRDLFSRVTALEQRPVGGGGSSGLEAHLGDASGAHAASAISYVGGTGISATDVEAAIDELADEKQNSPAHIPYTPTWTATGTNPTLGNGTLAGAYTQIGKFIHFYIDLAIGSTTNGGGGNYRWALPVTAAGTAFVMGVAQYFDASSGNLLIGLVANPSTTVCDIQYPASAPVGVLTAVSNSAPWAIGSGDVIRIGGSYRAA
jgi:hypothetical protein